ncbi:hypothetical protein GYMLUDRAFT_49468 [Collybiopsis luxurians FD-317 M1]|uniref:Autophagy-related protein 29 n=1 Tax=Collybiopsis luxurians FD-317 M1 TaxID=944289 RepID=A0A0D0BUM9_9AGAR|nr:hypothetical protein GYMLUDRAFT_49468 [Collybiopsis luxurians FD-317 M1]
MPSTTSAQNVRVVVRLPYNRPVNPEDQIVDPPRVEWNSEKADILWKVIEKSRASDSGGADWKGLAAHLQVPLPYLLYRVHARYQEDLRGLQDIPGVSSPLSPNAPSGSPWDASIATATATATTATTGTGSGSSGSGSTAGTTGTITGQQPMTNVNMGGRTPLGRLNTRLSPSIGGGPRSSSSTPLGIRARLNSIGQKTNLSSSTLTLQTPIARNPAAFPHLSPTFNRTRDRAGSSASPLSEDEDEDEMDSDDDEMLKEEEAERVAEEQEALDKKLADLQKMMTGDMLGLVSVGRKQGRQMAKQNQSQNFNRELERGRDLSASGTQAVGIGRQSQNNHHHNRHHYNASLSSRSASTSQSVSSASSPQGSLPEIPSPSADSTPQSPQPRSPLRRHMSPSKSSSPPTLSPRNALGQSHRKFAAHGHAAGRLAEYDRDRDGSEASTGSFSDLSGESAYLDGSLSGSALDSALLSNIRGNGSRIRFGASYRNGVPR